MTHKYEPRPCVAADLFKIEEGGPEVASFVEECDRYLSQFVAPVFNDKKERVCFNCGGVVNGMMASLGLTGHVAYRWGMAHGEAACTGCGWPARGMHYPKALDGTELFSLRNFYLEYLPHGEQK